MFGKEISCEFIDFERLKCGPNKIAFCLKYIIPFTILVFIIVHIVTMQ
jgi:hypothetical protein